MSLLTKNALLSLLITLAIIGSIAYLIDRLNRERAAELSAIQNQLATDTLSIDTQFALLEEGDCTNLTEGNVLSQEVNSLADKVAVTEERLGSDDKQVLQLKKQYTLLQIRDYLLTKRLAEACDLEPVVVLYFYSNEGDCEDCNRAGAALSYLRETYPSLRVYSFDSNLDLGALKTLLAVERIQAPYPAFVIEGKRSSGFTDVEAFEKLFPKRLFDMATGTPAKKP